MESLEKLKPLDFLHVLPGHRRRMSFKDKAAKDAAIDLTIAVEKANLVEPGAGRKIFRSKRMLPSWVPLGRHEPCPAKGKRSR